MKVNTPKDLSAVIRDCRKLKGWTQAELAERIGVYQKDVSNCETKPSVGDVLQVVPNHVCVVVNMFDQIVAVRDDTIVDVLPVAARGQLV